MYHASLLDSDTYKFSMGDFILKMQPRVLAQYEFINRANREFHEWFGKELQGIINEFRYISLTKDEKDFLREKCYYLDPAYIDFLAGYRYNPDEVKIRQHGPKLHVTVTGPMYRTIYWEVPLMATISELYFQREAVNYAEVRAKARTKAVALHDLGVIFSEFGTRRRAGYTVHKAVLEELIAGAGKALVGTSNVHLAMLYDLTPMGTIAHEVQSLYGALYGYQSATAMLLEDWVRVYQGDLGIVLTDTFTTDVFLKAFNTKFAKLFDGVRHDSGDPIKWVDKIVEHYKSKRIDPMTKTALFSDGIDSLARVAEIHGACKGRIKDAYGIGTWLTNPLPKPLNMVIKLMACDFGQGWTPTVKLSDNIGKNTGDAEAVGLCKQILGIKA